MLNFPSREELARVSIIRKYYHLYEGNFESALTISDTLKKQFSINDDVIYIGHSIPARISEFYGDFVQGKADQMFFTLEDPAQQEALEEIVEKNNLPEQVYDFAVEQSAYGYCPLLVYVENDLPVIESIPVDQYFPQKDGSVILATYKKDPEDSEGKGLLLYVQHYKQDKRGAYVERGAYKTDDSGKAVSAYPIQKMASILGVSEIKTFEALNVSRIPIVVITNNRGEFGESDYAKISPQVAEINEKASHISIQLLKNLDAKMQVPADMIGEDGTIPNFEAVGVSKDDAEPKYIVNSNPLIAETREHIIFELKFVSFMTGVPMFQLLKGGMPEKVESMRMQMFDAIRKTETKRSKIKKALQEALVLGFEMLGIEADKPEIVFSDVLPVDGNAMVAREADKVMAGISSKVSAMMRLENYTESEAKEELRRIASEGITLGETGSEDFA